MSQTYPDLSKVKRILVARLRHHGDVLLTTPVFQILKESLGDVKIDAYINKETAPILEGSSYIDDFILYDKALKKKGFFSKIAQEFRILKRCFLGKYDLVINLTEGDRGAIAALISRAKVRIGVDPEGSGMFGKNRCFTHLSKRSPGIRHTVERQIDVLRTLGIFPSPKQRELHFFIPPEDRLFIQELLEAYDLEEKKFIVIHPVSRWLFKCLPEKLVAELIDYLSQKEQKVVLTASSDHDEILMNKRIQALCSKKDLIDLSGRLTIKQLGALIDSCKLLICVDSLPLHLASAVKARVLVFFGPTSEKTWAPWRNPHARVFTQEEYPCRPCYLAGCAKSKKSDCLETIPIEKIISEVEMMLSFS